MEYQVFRDRAGFWRWLLRATNGLKIADSGEGYVNRSDCLRAIALVKGSNAAPIYDV
jgi:uncharacterized protein YegP (UPF0339 family)